MKTYYKVVWSSYEDQGLVSSNAPTRTLLVRYDLGHEVIAPIGGILVFEDWQKVMEYCRYTSGVGVFRCTGWDPVPLPPERFFSLLLGTRTSPEHPTYERLTWWICEEVWRGSYHRDLARYAEWPEGTVAVRHLVPLEYIDPPGGWRNEKNVL